MSNLLFFDLLRPFETSNSLTAQLYRKLEGHSYASPHLVLKHEFKRVQLEIVTKHTTRLRTLFFKDATLALNTVPRLAIVCRLDVVDSLVDVHRAMPEKNWKLDSTWDSCTPWRTAAVRKSYSYHTKTIPTRQTLKQYIWQLTNLSRNILKREHMGGDKMEETLRTVLRYKNDE